jgi:thiol-disulfide isomerase/thioredoxin
VVQQLEIKMVQHPADVTDAIRNGRLLFVKFFSPWCGHCRKIAPAWSALEDRFPRTAASIDCTQETGACSRYKVLGYPDLRLIRGKIQEVYTGARDEKSFVAYVLEQFDRFNTTEAEVAAGQDEGDTSVREGIEWMVEEYFGPDLFPMMVMVIALWVVPVVVCSHTTPFLGWPGLCAPVMTFLSRFNFTAQEFRC